MRVIAATHVDLRAASAQGQFREDLYFRLAIFPLHVPALRERPEDILAIAEQFLAGQNPGGNRGALQLDPSAIATLSEYPFPGNVRELINALERAIILCPDSTISAEDLGLPMFNSRSKAAESASTLPPSSSTPTRFPTFKEQERNFLLRALRKTHGRVHGPAGAAHLLDLKPTTLQSKLKKHGINRSAFVPTNPNNATPPPPPKATDGGSGGDAKDGTGQDPS